MILSCYGVVDSASYRTIDGQRRTRWGYSCPSPVGAGRRCCVFVELELVIWLDYSIISSDCIISRIFLFQSVLVFHARSMEAQSTGTPTVSHLGATQALL
jgi:hypothetical protein